MEEREVVLLLKKETKNTYRYEEEDQAGVPPVLRTLYIQKWVFGKNPPRKIKVKVAPA